MEAYPEADIDVTAVGFNMLFSDDRNEWNPDLLTDRRVTHYWDADQEIGTWFEENENLIGFDFNKGPIVWDSFFLLDSEATWDEFPFPLVTYGNTVLADKEELLAATQTILGS